jgi:hypothetical protein
MVGTVIIMERLRDFLSKPLASFTARPMTTGSVVRRRPPRPQYLHEGRGRSVGQLEREGDRQGCGSGHGGTVGRRTRVVGHQGSAAGKASKTGSVGLVGAHEGGKMGVVVVVGDELDDVSRHELRHEECRGGAKQLSLSLVRPNKR